MKPTIYDELEFFEKSGEYPFSMRKNQLPALMMKPNDTYSKTHKVLLRKNSVCYDKDIFGEFQFWKDEKCDDQNNYDFNKVKFSSSTVEEEPNKI